MTRTRLMAKLTTLLGLVAALAALGAASGCAVSKLRKISFEPTDEVNRGRTYYVVVRVADENAFLTDSYQSIASMVTATPRDTSLLKVKMFWPKQKRTLIVEAEKDQALAVYALFTNPSNEWKLLLTPPLKRTYRLLIDGNRIIDASQQDPEEKKRRERAKKKDK